MFYYTFITFLFLFEWISYYYSLFIGITNKSKSFGYILLKILLLFYIFLFKTYSNLLKFFYFISIPALFIWDLNYFAGQLLGPIDTERLSPVKTIGEGP